MKLNLKKIKKIKNPNRNHKTQRRLKILPTPRWTRQQTTKPPAVFLPLHRDKVVPMHRPPVAMQQDVTKGNHHCHRSPVVGTIKRRAVVRSNPPTATAIYEAATKTIPPPTRTVNFVEGMKKARAAVIRILQKIDPAKIVQNIDRVKAVNTIKVQVREAISVAAATRKVMGRMVRPRIKVQVRNTGIRAMGRVNTVHRAAIPTAAVPVLVSWGMATKVQEEAIMVVKKGIPPIGVKVNNRLTDRHFWCNGCQAQGEMGLTIIYFVYTCTSVNAFQI